MGGGEAGFTSTCACAEGQFWFYVGSPLRCEQLFNAEGTFPPRVGREAAGPTSFRLLGRASQALSFKTSGTTFAGARAREPGKRGRGGYVHDGRDDHGFELEGHGKCVEYVWNVESM